MPIKLDMSHPMNQLVLHYLGHGRKPSIPRLQMPESVQDAYMGQGSHPDVVEWVWDKLGPALPADCRCLVYGTPALVHPSSGIILVICNGTAYNLRLTPVGLREALAQGARTMRKWSNGQEMDAAQVLGPDWVFGFFSQDEQRWCRAMYETLNVARIN